MPELAAARLGVPARGMLVHQTLPMLLAPAQLVSGRRRDIDALLAWGRRPSARQVERLGRTRGIPIWHLEDGFLRSLEKGRDHPPLGLLVDDMGVHFDATAPSRLERLIVTPLTQGQFRRARQVQTLWCEQRLSKINPSRDSPIPKSRFVLVIDQSAGDCSIPFGLANQESFRQMLQVALADHPACTVVVRLHPDVIRGRARGHFTPQDLAHPRILLSMDSLHPAGLLQQAEAVYVVTSQMGFESLLWGRTVHCFGMPFYAGWGLTHDRILPPKRRQTGIALEALVHAALIAYPRCIDPHQHQPCSIEVLIQAIGLQRRIRSTAPRQVQAFGFTPWKQRSLQRFMAGSCVRFPMPWHTLGRQVDAVAVWGRRGRRRVIQAADQRRLPILRVEDGFLRSVGLGADLIDPISWVVDGSGAYYDATKPSDLEILLSFGEWTNHQRERAARLRQRLVSAAITKYNLSEAHWRRPHTAERVVLVVGQVESDASIRFGAPGLHTNLELLQAVRATEPKAHLVYKPHPDVVAGLCQAGKGEKVVARYCDEVLTSGSIHQILMQIDSMHVLTSLTGFEALLRGVKVHCWGLPFYAGWGLTYDQKVCSRRGRSLHLDALVHAVLIDYPRYISRHSGWFITPEQAIEELITWRDSPKQRRTPIQALFRHWGRLRHR
ncbi:capsular polysaccharide biosynthesis protein [Synechococcus sp. M16CYN]|uniref:capsular polysaccharide biosynthesis protein n=1 Tax=Synechococcus sp. M16CYN TaxID=3103139 RepID=UPI00324DE995